MARKRKNVEISGKNQGNGAGETELTREQKIAAFLKAGGKIQQIPTGVSGQEKLTGPKHITLGNKSGSR